MGLNASEVVSMAGLRVMPDLSLGEFVPNSAPILILSRRRLLDAGRTSRSVTAGARGDCRDRPVATICAATLALAHCGLLDDRRTPATGASSLVSL